MMDSLTNTIFTTDYEDIDETLQKIPLNKRVGLVVILNNIKYEFLIHIKSNKDELICLGPSGLPDMEHIDKFKSRPVFTRHRWNFDKSIILYNDNTRYVWDGAVGCGWGIGLPDDYFLENIKDMIVKIAQHFHILNKNILFYGSSMGGFTSIQLATMIKDSYAIAENPQIDARNWIKTFYLKRGMESELYEEKTLSQIEAYKYNVLNMIKKENYIPNLIIIHDINSEDIKYHLMEFIEELSKLPFKEDDFHKIKIIIEPMNKHGPIPIKRLFEIFNAHDAIYTNKYKYKIDYGDLNYAIEVIKNYDLFDEEYYKKSYPNLNQLDSLTHYLTIGWKEGKNPSAEFDNDYYLEQYEDVKEMGMNPLVHYAIYGIEENLPINEEEFLKDHRNDVTLIEESTLFDKEYYIENCKNLENLTPAEHYLLKGWKEGKNPSKQFNNDYYINKYDEVRHSNINPLIDYLKNGKNEKCINEQYELHSYESLIPLLKESNLFDEEYYIKNCKNLEDLTPAEHYLLKGWKEGKNPSKQFNNDSYLDGRPGVRTYGMNPLIHYIKYGKKEDEIKKRLNSNTYKIKEKLKKNLKNKRSFNALYPLLKKMKKIF